METIRQRFTVPFSYDVHFTKDLFSGENTVLAMALSDHAYNGPVKVFFVVDSGVSSAHPSLIDDIHTYFSRFNDKLQLMGTPLEVLGGEGVKNNPGYVETILEAVNGNGIDRHSYIAIIGGGSVLDMAGYAASIAHRGVRQVRIPTTVLSQNDSGVGVKNGINAFGKKNFLGCFTPPALVINDLNFLHTLDDRDWRAGISEALKVALIKDREFYNWIQDNAEALSRRNSAPMETLIHRCARMHVDHISGGDPFEMGSSRPLDFGHWSAHKLEQLSNYRLRHGEAVAIGIALDTIYSCLKGYITKEDCEKVLNVFITLGFDLFVPELERENTQTGLPEVMDGLQEFREHLGGILTIMLLKDIGKGFEVHEIENSTMTEAIRYLKSWQPATV